MDYEFDIVLDMDWDHRAVVTKSRFDDIADQVVLKPGEDMAEKIYAWLTSGEAAPPGVRGARRMASGCIVLLVLLLRIL